MNCPSCGAEASGKFCSSCGGPLSTETCSSCGAPAPPGGKFCTSCGSAIGGTGARARAAGGQGKGGSGPGRRGQGEPQELGARDPGARQASLPGGRNPAWWAAGALLILVIVALGYPVLSRSSANGLPGGGSQGIPGMGGGEAGGGPVDITTMPLDEQATILFNRVMTSNSAGDSADVAFFLPKALIIHEQLDPTDPDGLYHYALLLMVGEDFSGALAKAREGLAEVPDYLLLLAVGGEASAALGDTLAAGDYYAHFLDVYDVEMGLMRFGYEHHQAILPAYREEAAAFLGRG